MTDEHRETLGANTPHPDSDSSKDPETWTTGEEPMTGPQRSYLDTLAREAGEELPADLTKAEASEHIDRLQQKTGRGADGSGADGSDAGSGTGPSTNS